MILLTKTETNPNQGDKPLKPHFLHSIQVEPSERAEPYVYGLSTSCEHAVLQCSEARGQQQRAWANRAEIRGFPEKSLSW